MPNFEDVQSDNVVDRSDAISDPTDMSSLWRGTRNFSPQEAAINIGKWYNKVTGNGPPDQMPEGSMSADAGYNAIGKGYDDGGQVTGLPPNADTNTTDETPASMEDVTGSIGATGTQGPSQGGGVEWFPQASEKDKSSNPDLASYLFHKATGQGQSADQPQQGGGVDYTNTPSYQEAKESESPFAPGNLSQSIGNVVEKIPGYGPPLRKLAHEVTDYLFQKYANDPKSLAQGGPDTMDNQTATVIASHVNPDGSIHNESEKALEYSFKKGGPDVAGGFMQNRVANYNAIRAWSTAAYDGNNLQAAVEGMNKAFRAMPLSENIHFGVGDNASVTATVVKPDGSDPVHFSLTGPQFRELMMGNTGFPYDLVRDPSAVLAKLVSTNHDMWAPPTSQGVKADPRAGVVPDSWKNMGVNQSMWNIAHQMFPMVADDRRNQFLMGQVATKQKYEQELAQKKAEGANRLGYAQEMNRGREQVAETNVTGRKEVEGMRGETQRDIAGTRAKSYDERSVLQAQSRLNDANVRQQIAAQNIPVKLANNILTGIRSGSITEDQGDAMLKRGGTSLSQLMELLKPQQTPTSAPQVQGAAQVAQPKGGTWTFPGGKPDPKKPNGGAIWTPNQ
jgi:hypothetical protein